jgi:hypothetical protein
MGKETTPVRKETTPVRKVTTPVRKETTPVQVPVSQPLARIKAKLEMGM